MADLDDNIELKIARLELGPGDILVCSLKRPVPREVLHRMREIIRQITDNKCLFLDGVELSVLTAAEIAQRTEAE